MNWCGKKVAVSLFSPINSILSREEKMNKEPPVASCHQPSSLLHRSTCVVSSINNHITYLRFLQIQPIPSSPGTHPFCLFSFTSHSSTVSLIRFNPFFALYAIPTGLILRFLTQSLRFCCCSFDLDCGFFSFSIFFGWIVGIENFAGFWIWVWILWWSGWFCRSGVFWVDLVVLVDGVFVDFTWIEFIDVFLLNSVDLVYIGVMDLLVLGWLQIELRGN